MNEKYSLFITSVLHDTHVVRLKPMDLIDILFPKQDKVSLARASVFIVNIKDLLQFQSCTDRQTNNEQQLRQHEKKSRWRLKVD